MANTISIPKSEDVEGLRKSTEVAVNRFITQQNKTQNSLQTHFDANGFKIQNLGNPAGQKDAVPLDYLKNAIKKIQLDLSRKPSTSGGGEHGLAHFGIGVGAVVSIGNDLSPHHIVAVPGSFQSAYINAKTGPTGTDLIVDLQLWNGASWASIFGGTKLVLAAGSASTDVGTQTTFAAVSAAVGNLIRVDVTQVGSTFAGQDISVMLRWS